MNNGLTLLNKIYIYIALTGFIGCVLSYLFCEFKKKSTFVTLESISTFLMGCSFAGVIIERVMPHQLFLNILLSIITGLITRFIALHFLSSSLKKPVQNIKEYC